MFIFVTVHSKPIKLKPEIFSLQHITSCIRPHLCVILQKLGVVLNKFLCLVQMQILVLFNCQVSGEATCMLGLRVWLNEKCILYEHYCMDTGDTEGATMLLANNVISFAQFTII